MIMILYLAVWCLFINLQLHFGGWSANSPGELWSESFAP